MWPISSGLPKSATPSAIVALLYLSFNKGASLSRSNSSTPTLTYCESTKLRKTCCLAFDAAQGDGVLARDATAFDYTPTGGPEGEINMLGSGNWISIQTGMST